LFGGSWIVTHHGELAAALPPLAALEGWRSAFLLCGLSGLVTAALVLTVAEPARMQAGRHAFRGVLTQIAKRWRAYGAVSGGMLCLALCAFATAAWAPTVLTRVQGMTLQAAGQLTAGAALIGGALFAYLSGLLVDALHRRRSPDGVLVVSLLLAGVLAALAGIGGIGGLRAGASAAWIVIYALLGVPTVLAGTALQLMTPARMRAQVMAIHLLLVNLLALSLGPLLVAVLSERLFGSPASVGQSLAVVDAIAAGLAGLLFLVGRKGFIATAAEAR
jgi:MFS family permease